MKEYTIRIFTDDQIIVEYLIIAKNMFIAEDEALHKFADSGIPGRVTYLTTQGPA